jgi:hypothetical protein
MCPPFWMSSWHPISNSFSCVRVSFSHCPQTDLMCLFQLFNVFCPIFDRPTWSTTMCPPVSMSAMGLKATFFYPHSIVSDVSISHCPQTDLMCLFQLFSDASISTFKCLLSVVIVRRPIWCVYFHCPQTDLIRNIEVDVIKGCLMEEYKRAGGSCLLSYINVYIYI